MSTTYEAVGADVLVWVRATFPQETTDSAFEHLMDKAAEGLDVFGDANRRRKVVSCALILVHLADLAGIDDLPAAMAAKLVEDKASRFEMDPAAGYARRVKGGAA